MGAFQNAASWLKRRTAMLLPKAQEVPYEAEEPISSAQVRTVRAPEDPFGKSEDDYGGRTPYRSRSDRRQDQLRAAEQAAAQQQAFASRGYTGQMPPVNGNVMPFPNTCMTPDGSTYAHVEYVVLLRSRNECKDVISYIRSNASVFLNLEFIASDSERQRCVDMLSGAAYTLGCALNKISPHGMYLISSPAVRVVLDPALRRMPSASDYHGYDHAQYSSEAYAAPQVRPTQFSQPFPRTQPAQSPAQPAVQYPEPPSGQPVSSFGAGSPTSRFQAQGMRHSHASFGSVMAGSTPDMFPAASGRGRRSLAQ